MLGADAESVREREAGPGTGAPLRTRGRADSARSLLGPQDQGGWYSGSMTDIEATHRRHVAVMRGWLRGRDYHLAASAMEFARDFHRGMRKDGVTPEFHHQVRIAGFVRTLEPHLLHPEETLAATFLHDICEDFDVGYEEIRERFGEVVCGAVRLLTKKYRGSRTPYEVYFAEMAANPIASVVKGGDRSDNIQSMLGVFNLEKQKRYLAEVEDYFLPMLKAARRRFPKQEPAYENIKIMLRSQTALLREIHRAHDALAESAT